MTEQIVNSLVIDGSLSPAKITTEYEGPLDLDALITAVMNAHGPRLQVGTHKAEYWAYRKGEQLCRIAVKCDWHSENEKLMLLAFSFVPLPSVSPDEIIWIADVNFHEVAGNNPPEVKSTKALIIVSYRKDGIYPIVFPYYEEANGMVAYEEPMFHGGEVPDGFVNLALRSMFEKDVTEEEEQKTYAGRHIAAAMASCYGHSVVFPNDEDLDTPLATKEEPCTTD